MKVEKERVVTVHEEDPRGRSLGRRGVRLRNVVGEVQMKGRE